jgi:hypothetical protein
MSTGVVASSVLQALELVRSTEPENAPPDAIAVIEAAIDELWTRIRASRDTYIMKAGEFALFNYYRGRYSCGQDQVIAQRAVARFWNNHTADNRSC